MLQSDGGKSSFYMYQWVTLNYRCNTADGSQQDLSELVVWPYRNYGVCETTPAAEQLVIGCHSTITSNAQCPSNFSNLSSLGEINMLALFANAWSQNALVVVPDYEGYGSTASIPHPYCNRELTAEQVVTGAKAGLSYYENNVTKMDPNWTGVAIGYSQGGAVAAGVLRYCQEHNETSLRLKGAVCGDGPYDPLATLKRYIEMDKLYMPVAPSLLLKGAVDTDPDMIALGCRYEDFVTDKFFQTGIFDMIRDKQHTTDDIQTALLNHSYKYGDEGGFTPYNGFTFFHSIGDEVVPYCNFESVRNTWGVNSITALSYQSSTTLHVATGTAFFLEYCGNLVDEILKGKWAPREETVGGHFWKERN